MGGAEGVVRAFLASGKAAQAPALAQGVHEGATACEDFVCVGLVAYVPDDFILRRIKDVMKCHGQLDNAKPCAQMPAGAGNGCDGFRAQFRCELLELLRSEAAYIRRNVDGIE